MAFFLFFVIWKCNESVESLLGETFPSSHCWTKLSLVIAGRSSFRSLLGEVLSRHCWAKPGNLLVATIETDSRNKFGNDGKRDRWEVNSGHLERVMCLRTHSDKDWVCQVEGERCPPGTGNAPQNTL